MSPVTINGPRLRGRDGFSELVIERDPDGRLRISVHDETGPGVTATFGETDSGVIADFIKNEPPRSSQ